MMIIKILKRKDAASVIVAVVLAMIIVSFLPVVTGKLAGQISGLKEGQYLSYSTNGGWKAEYLDPVVWAALQIILLEILCWVYVFAHKLVARR